MLADLRRPSPDAAGRLRQAEGSVGQRYVLRRTGEYETQQKDRKIVIEGFDWINKEARKRFDKPFYDLDATQQTAICDDIHYLPDAKSKYKKGAQFFAKYRNLTMGGYYTTNIGTHDAGYVGNVALATFDGPPPEVLKQLGIDDASA